jgi:hypothetical protein
MFLDFFYFSRGFYVFELALPLTFQDFAGFEVS